MVPLALTATWSTVRSEYSDGMTRPAGWGLVYRDRVRDYQMTKQAREEVR